MQSAAKVGIVNSEFEPPLNTTLIPALIQPGECAKVVANEQVCDPRALCESKLVGGVPSGVHCSCVGPGLRNKPGSPDDGRTCEEDTSLRSVLKSESLTVDVSKPGNLTNRLLSFHTEAHGEAELNVTFNVAMALETSDGSVIATNNSIRVDQPSVSAFGFHIEWKLSPPTATWVADLDGSRLRFVDTSQHEFGVRIACDGSERICAADGDVITTLFELHSPSKSELHADVTFRSNVKALASCDHSKARIVYGEAATSASVTTSAAVRVLLDAYDVDAMPVSYTRASVEFRFGMKLLPPQWNRGSNRYVAEVPVAGSPGIHTVSVTLRQGWDNVSSSQRNCILLERQIEVREDDNGIQRAVVIGVVAGVVAFILALGCICLKKQSSAKCLIAVVPGRALSSRSWLWPK